MLRTLVGLAATAMLIQLAMAANYTVGGPSGSWDSSTDLQTWVASQKFVVGDNLSKLYAHINITIYYYACLFHDINTGKHNCSKHVALFLYFLNRPHQE